MTKKEALEEAKRLFGDGAYVEKCRPIGKMGPYQVGIVYDDFKFAEIVLKGGELYATGNSYREALDKAIERRMSGEVLSIRHWRKCQKRLVNPSRYEKALWRFPFSLL